MTHAVTTIRVELAANVAITKGAITIAGLYGYKRNAEASTGKIPIEVTKNGELDSATLKAEAEWDGISKLVLMLQEAGPGLMPAVVVPSGSVAVRSADVLVVTFQMRNGGQQAPYEVSVYADQYEMMPWPVDVGPDGMR